MTVVVIAVDALDGRRSSDHLLDAGADVVVVTPRTRDRLRGVVGTALVVTQRASDAQLVDAELLEQLVPVFVTGNPELAEQLRHAAAEVCS